MRIITWNINSVRLRIDLLARLIDDTNPDIVCLQETKTPDEHFPFEPIRERGFEHIFINGMKNYNGVAILSKHRLHGHTILHRCGREDCRHIAAEIHGDTGAAGVEIHNLYVPAGGDVPDPEANDKFAHKLDFVDELTGWWRDERAADKPMILVGDLNIAPLENDVWSHKQLLNVVSHTPVEVEKLLAMQDAIGWVDAVRSFVDPAEKLYSWWSYRARDWLASDRGRRLDHIWITPALKDRLRAAFVLKEVRGWERPSDHAPVVADFDFG